MFRKIIFSVILFSLSACAQPGRESVLWNPGSGGSFSDLTGEHNLTPTIYFLYEVRKESMSCRPYKMRHFFSAAGVKLQSVCEEAYLQCRMQGSCDVVEKGRVTPLNYQSQEGGRDIWSTYDPKRCKSGMGVLGHCLDPYRSVAADLDHWRVGDVIFVPMVVGLVLPDGSLHDGFFIIRDTGGAIQGRHRFDFFVGRSSRNRLVNVFTKIGLGDKNTDIKYRAARPDEARRTLEARNFASAAAK